MTKTMEHTLVRPQLELHRNLSLEFLAALAVFWVILIWDQGGLRLKTVLAHDVPSATREALIPKASRKPAPNFSITDIEGTPLSLSQFRGKVVLLDFWGTTCGGCKIELPWYVAFDRDFGSRGLSLIGLDMYGEKPSVVRTFVNAWHMKYPVAIGTDRIGDEFHVQELPMTLLIDRHGRIALSHVGIVDQHQFQTDIKALLRER